MIGTASSIAGRDADPAEGSPAPLTVVPTPCAPDAAAHPFDELAAGYDADFVAGAVGGRMRRALWRRVDARFAAGERVLDLGCGTGEDAVHLAARGVTVTAIDASAAMAAAARDKAARAGLTERIVVRRFPIEELDRLDFAESGEPQHRRSVVERGGDRGNTHGSGGRDQDCQGSAALPSPRFDGALSSFGALNCVADLPAVARALAALLKPGAPILLCLMGPTVPWEWAWFLARGRPATAFRRLRPGGVAWRGLTVRYPSIGALRRAFAPAFRLTRVAAIGALVPPTFAERWAAARPRLLDRLESWERRWETAPPLPWLADHYLAELERR